MNKYNERWTREKFIEYRKLKRSGHSHKMLKDHFGEDIYHSGLYNKNGITLPTILKYGNYITEIKITPENTDYNYLKQPSNFIKNETDYIISFYSNDLPYIISLIYFPINDTITYNVVFTTRDQWNSYEYKLKKFLKKGNITDVEFQILEEIISKETKLNDLFPIFRKLSWILLDFYDKYIKNELLSIGHTKNENKINLYRNIIEDSFTNITETMEKVNKTKYYVYNIK